MAKLQDYYSSANDTTHLLKAIELSGKAIDCSESNTVAYHVKLASLNLLGRYSESLTVLDKMYQLSGQTDIKTFAEKGLVYEAMGLGDSARLIYDNALSQCDLRLTSRPMDSIQLMCDKFYVVALSSGKDEALKRFDEYFSNSMSPTLDAFRNYLMNFDKEKVLFPK